MSSQTNDTRRLVVDFISFPYLPSKTIIANLCCSIRYLFASLHQAAKPQVEDLWENLHPVYSYWKLHPYQDPMFKLMFSKGIRHQLRQLVTYSELSLRERFRDPSIVLELSESPKTTSFLPTILRDFFDKSHLLLDRAHKWLTWLDSKLSTEFNLPIEDGFTCATLRLPDSLSCLFKMMDHDLHVEDICRMRAFSFLHLLKISRDFKPLPFKVFESSILDDDEVVLLSSCPSHFKHFFPFTYLTHQKPSKSFVECIRCFSMEPDSPKLSSCSCGGSYRYIWRPTCPSSEWRSVASLFGPNCK